MSSLPRFGYEKGREEKGDHDPDHISPLDYEEQLIRIRRAGAESEKFIAEQRKLSEEALKLMRDRTLAPYVVLPSLLAGVVSGTAVALVTHLLR